MAAPRFSFILATDNEKDATTDRPRGAILVIFTLPLGTFRSTNLRHAEPIFSVICTQDK